MWQQRRGGILPQPQPTVVECGDRRLHNSATAALVLGDGGLPQGSRAMSVGDGGLALKADTQRPHPLSFAL